MTTVSPLRRVEETPTKVSLVAAAICIGSCAVVFFLGFVKVIEIGLWFYRHVKLVMVP